MSTEYALERELELTKLKRKEREYEILKEEFLISLLRTTINLNETKKRISELE